MKTKVEVRNHIKTLYAFKRNPTGFSIKKLTIDNGTEFNNTDTMKWILDMGHGIRHETSCVYTPEINNRTAERAIRMILEMER
jgi:putative salt-induced outer membrane protein YdiY